MARSSADGGRTSQQKGALGKEVAAAPDGTLYAISGGGHFHRSTDAVKWSVAVLT